METTEDTEALGRQIRAARKTMGLSQSEVAEVAGCSQRFVSELERGKKTAEIGKVLAVIRAVNHRFVMQAKETRVYASRRLEDYL